MYHLLSSINTPQAFSVACHPVSAHPLDFIFNNTNNWEEDVLAKDVILSNQSSQVNFYGDANNCLFDIKAVFKDGSDLEDYRILIFVKSLKLLCS